MTQPLINFPDFVQVEKVILVEEQRKMRLLDSDVFRLKLSWCAVLGIIAQEKPTGSHGKVSKELSVGSVEESLHISISVTLCKKV